MLSVRAEGAERQGMDMLSVRCLPAGHEEMRDADRQTNASLMVSGVCAADVGHLGEGRRGVVGQSVPSITSITATVLKADYDSVRTIIPRESAVIT